MPKSQYISPSDAFASGFLTFDKIPLCQYKKTLAQEKKLYTKADFLADIPGYADYPGV